MFWNEKALNEMSDNEWESLCDGCGRCCVWKFEDDDSHEILYTDIRCHLFNDSTCRCADYPQRRTIVPECMDIRALSDKQYAWLPTTCAYRLRHEGKPLFDWHPLIAGNKESMHAAGISLQHGTTSPEGITEEDIIRHIIDPDEPA